VKIVTAVIVVVVLGLAGVLLVAYSGIYDVGMGNHDNAVMNWIFETGMERSVKQHARGIVVPALDDSVMIRDGFRHYRHMCVSCHGAPGVEPGEIAKGLWPEAPKLADTADEWSPAQLYWIIKNGIKFSSMPGWGPTHDDHALWAMTAFVAQLPKMSPTTYRTMVEEARAAAPAGEPGREGDREHQGEREGDHQREHAD
jgi:mono/diheme cytochrome c family protein